MKIRNLVQDYFEQTNLHLSGGRLRPVLLGMRCSIIGCEGRCESQLNIYFTYDVET